MNRRSTPWRTLCRVLLTAFSLLVCRTAGADGAETPRTGRETVTLATSLVTPFFGAYYLEANVRASNAFGLFYNASYVSLDGEDDWHSKSGTLGSGISYSFGHEALRRWYVEAWGEVWLSSWRHGPSGEVAPLVAGYAAGSLAGYRFIWDAGPVLDLAAGVVGAYLPSAHVQTDDGPVSSEAITMLYPAVKVNVGWAF